MKPRDLPAVHAVLRALEPAISNYPRDLAVSEVRRALDSARSGLLQGTGLEEPVETTVLRRLLRLRTPSLRHVINATGVVLHTNLGRAPLPSFDVPVGYSNLEYDLETGKRGKRDNHLSDLLEAILGAPGIAVNNNASALFLILNEFALGAEAIVSRGELIEIGDGFRIPEIMQRSGVALREVGTTNRTSVNDYRAAITERTRLLLRVHRSNFRIAGLTAQPSLAELAALSRESGIPLYEDLGSGCMVDLGLGEPLVQDSLAAGVSLVSFSGDKLLGGPQAGLIAGDAELIQRIRRNPLFRALRQDKLFTHAMAQTLCSIAFGELDCIPVVRMIRMGATEIRCRAEQLMLQIRTDARLEPGESVIGGGATPEHTLPTWVVSLNESYCEGLRRNNPPVIARMENGRTLLDLRTVFPHEEPALAQALS